ncbi:MAG: hypothetical protein WA101_03230 [Minisyncoccia bacterium]
MKEIIKLKPYKYGFKEMFKNLNKHIFGFSESDWSKYQKNCNVSFVDYLLQSLDLSDLYYNVPKIISLWEISGEEIEIEPHTLYGDFVIALNKKDFLPAPKGTGLWLPIGLKEEEIVLNEKLKIISEPINRIKGDTSKTMGIELEKNEKNAISINCFELRAFDTLFYPEDKVIVQRIN